MKKQHLTEVAQLRNHLDEIFPKGGLERFLDDEKELERIAPRINDPKCRKDCERARSGIKKLARKKEEDVKPEEMLAIEAIILDQGRPAIDVINNTFTTPEGLWAHIGAGDIRTRIENAIPSVGRIELPGNGSYPYGGTGFIVGSNLIMTNRHVAVLFSSGLGKFGLRFLPGQRAGVDFLMEWDSDESIYVTVREILMVHPFWDMAILEVSELPAKQVPLQLSTVDPDGLKDREIGVIGYPAFDSRNDASLQNRIFGGIYNVKRIQPGVLTGRQNVSSFENINLALKHNASTLGGNSGSAVIDLATGMVVGLHFAGIYKESNYAVPTFELSRDSFIRDAGVNFSGEIPTGTTPWMARWLVADPELGEDVKKCDIKLSSPDGKYAIGDSKMEGNIKVVIPLEISVSVRALMPPTSTGIISKPDISLLGVDEKPKTVPDTNYNNREGYDVEFLPGDNRLRLPWLSDEQYGKVAFNMQATSKRHVLSYHHFSVVMNRERRVAFFTAVNIDGSKDMDIDRKEFTDFWSPDPRIDENAQMDNDYYKDYNDVINPLDRGHLVRRLDPCWGNSRSDVLKAHHDTFHYTNCSPQHSKFNQNSTLWLGIEEYVLGTANAKNKKVSVFSGPVLDDDDPIYMTPTGHQIQIPLQYWKVVAMTDTDGKLRATAYLLSQEGEIDSMLEFIFGEYRDYQTTIKNIESLTDLEFQDLASADILEKTTEGVKSEYKKLIRSYQDVVI